RLQSLTTTFVSIDQMLMSQLFSFRQTLVFILILVGGYTTNAQIVDGLLGQRRTLVQVMLRPYRIIDYKKERVVHNIESGIHQTVLFENDTCKRFYWAVTPEKMDKFKSMLLDGGYRSEKSIGFVKDSLELIMKPLNSGKATLFVAALSKELKGNRTLSGKIIKKKRAASLEAMPLLQQAILAQERDTTPKPKKDPSDHWVGGKYGKTNILGWEK
ncbi:MAG: hypothetical protein ACI8P5_001308, partial [Bacteroidia bacterium]